MIIQPTTWAVGYQLGSDASALRFEFSDQAPVELLLDKEAALAVARAILSQYQISAPASVN